MSIFRCFKLIYILMLNNQINTALLQLSNTTPLSLSLNNAYYYDYNRELIENESQDLENSNSNSNLNYLKINKIRLNTNFRFKCDLNISNELQFEQVLFNKSLFNIEESLPIDTSSKSPYTNENSYFKVKPQILLQKIDKSWNTNEINVKNSKYSDSGRYYCVYSEKSTKNNDKKDEYFATSFLYLIYDGKISCF